MYIFFITLFLKQNSYHRHGILIHTLRVVFEIIKYKNFRMIPAGFLHDIGKPFAAHQKPEDILNKEYSFTGHEEISFQKIKNIPFISEYTKLIVRHHYLLRLIEKAEKKNSPDFLELKNKFSVLPLDIQEDLRLFLICDDLGKGI